MIVRDPLKIGIVGIGRLGRALAGRLAPHHALALHDIDRDRALAVSRALGLETMHAAALCRWADMVVLCLPQQAVAAWLAELPESARDHPLFADTSTSFADAIPASNVVGLRPVGQFAAIESGLPALLVTAAPAALRARLADAMAPIGPVIAGDESMVGPLNEMVTRATFALCRKVEAYRHRGSPLPDTIVAAALGNVAVGSLLDYPPSPDNAYAARLLPSSDGDCGVPR